MDVFNVIPIVSNLLITFINRNVLLVLNIFKEKVMKHIAHVCLDINSIKQQIHVIHVIIINLNMKYQI